jgi:hypothetical protein
MTEWMRKNAITLAMIIITWTFTVGYVKAQTEWRLDALEEDVSELDYTIQGLDKVVTRLEVIVERLEEITDK